MGSVLLWLGDAPDEAVPEEARPRLGGRRQRGRPTAKAQAMLKELGLDPAQIPASGERLTVADIEAWLAGAGKRALREHAAVTAGMARRFPMVPGTLQDSRSKPRHAEDGARGIGTTRCRRTSKWSTTRSPGTTTPRATPREHKLMLSPLMPLLAWRLVVLGRERPSINATIVNNRRYQYRPVNLGFTVQVGDDALPDGRARCAANGRGALHRRDGDVQRNAMAHKLRANETSGATLAFSSMARWKVSRHIPILPPHTSLMVAHAAPREHRQGRARRELRSPVAVGLRRHAGAAGADQATGMIGKSTTGGRRK